MRGHYLHVVESGPVRNGVYLDRSFRTRYRRPLRTRIADLLFGIALLLVAFSAIVLVVAVLAFLVLVPLIYAVSFALGRMHVAGY